MPFGLLMDCAEYRSLNIQHEYARRRVWLFGHPHTDPVLSISGVAPSEHQVFNARAEELEVAAAALGRERFPSSNKEPLYTSVGQ